MLNWIEKGFNYFAESEYGTFWVRLVPGTVFYQTTLELSRYQKQDLGYWPCFEEAQDAAEKSLLFKQAIHHREEIK